MAADILDLDATDQRRDTQFFSHDTKDECQTEAGGDSGNEGHICVHQSSLSAVGHLFLLSH